MTTERVDLDRLADFVGGALEGTPAAVEVRALIDTDPAWAAAHADLVEATAAVSVDLRAVGSRRHAVPEDVAARLDALFRPVESESEATAVSGSRTASGGGEPGGAPAARAENTRGGPGERRPGGTTASGPRGTGPGRRGRRARWAAALSAAAAVIAVGVGFVALVPSTRSGDDSAATAPNDDSPGGAAAPQVAGGPPPTATGRDYRPGSFAGLGSAQRAEGQMPPRDSDSSAGPDRVEGGEPFSAQNDAKATVPPELARLTGAADRQDCLDAIKLVHGGVPIVVEFARFNGNPALIVQLDGARSGNGKPWVVAAGPDCGREPGDVDELYSGPLA